MTEAGTRQCAHTRNLTDEKRQLKENTGQKIYTLSLQQYDMYRESEKEETAPETNKQKTRAEAGNESEEE